MTRSRLFEALKTAGITVEILPATGTDTSIESAGMKITQVTDYGAGKQRISFIIGRVSASIPGEAKAATEDPLFGTPARHRPHRHRVITTTRRPRPIPGPGSRRLRSRSPS